MIASLKDLAQALDLSQTTVSRALNGYPEVGKATRKKVVEAAARLGYQPNPAARRLATGRADALGIVFSVEANMLENPIVTDLLTGISETAADQSRGIHLAPTTAGAERFACARLMASGTVDALILVSPILDDRETERLTGLDFPIVCHGRPLFDQGVASLSIDNRGGFHQATAHLTALGHRRIALINGEENRAYGLDRRKGYLDALAKAGIAPEPGLMASGRQVFAYGLEAARRMLAAQVRPTAFLCTSILVAIGVAKAVSEAGLSIPADVSLIAHDDIVAALPAEMVHPALTTLSSSVRLAGRRIAAMAIERSEGTPADRLTEVWGAALTIRGSTAPCRPSMARG